MTADVIVEQLRSLGTAGYKKVMQNHGVPEPIFGVKIEELKKIQKKVKKDYQLALDLYDTGIYDAQYLAGLIADDAKMTKKDLTRWLKTANCYPLFEYTIAWVAAESRYGAELAREWIESKKEGPAAAGWSIWSNLVSIKPDAELDAKELSALLQRVERTIHDQPNRVRYAMNNFVICVGCYVTALTEEARRVGKKIGVVSVDMGGTACKVPLAEDSIAKVAARGSIGKKRKSAKC